MGVVYKLSQELINFIEENKKISPALSCRKLAELIKDKFQLEVSKSSVNKVLKNSGMSMPVGRRKTKRKYILKERIAGAISAGTALPKEEVREMLPVQEEKPLLEEIKPLSQPKEESEKILPQAIGAEQEKIQLPEENLKPEPAPEPEPRSKPVPVPLEVIPDEELPAELVSSGAIILRAADSLVNGSQSIAGAIQGKFKSKIPDLTLLTAGLAYLPLLEEYDAKANPEKIWALLGKKAGVKNIRAFKERLGSLEAAGTDILKTLSCVFREVRCIKVALSDISSVYLDGQMHSVWSSPYVPHGFSSALSDIKMRLARCLNNNHALVLFVAAGYEAPTEEFFKFLSSLDFINNKIVKITLCDQKLEEIEIIQLETETARKYLFGMWPWQFTACRKVKDVGQFNPHQHPVTGEKLYLADIELELTQPVINKTLNFRGCSLKRSLTDKVKLVILGNLPQGTPAGEIADRYLCRWPNLEEGFQDYSKKVELFTYSGGSRHIPPVNGLSAEGELAADTGKIMKEFLKMLDLYVRWHFFPVGYENKAFADMLENFYRLDCRLKRNPDTLTATFLPQASYPYTKELGYACRRINEKEIFIEGRRFCCQAGPAE